MSDSISKPFSRAEIEAMRKLGADEAGRRGAAALDQSFWAKLKRVARRLPFAEDLVAAYFCAVDSTTPMRVKVILAGAVAYFVLPLDGVADFLPLVGFADDAAVLAAAIAQVAGAINERHREMAREALAEPAES